MCRCGTSRPSPSHIDGYAAAAEWIGQRNAFALCVEFSHQHSLALDNRHPKRVAHAFRDGDGIIDTFAVSVTEPGCNSVAKPGPDGVAQQLTVAQWHCQHESEWITLSKRLCFRVAGAHAQCLPNAECYRRPHIHRDTVAGQLS